MSFLLYRTNRCHVTFYILFYILLNFIYSTLISFVLRHTRKESKVSLASPSTQSSFHYDECFWIFFVKQGCKMYKEEQCSIYTLRYCDAQCTKRTMFPLLYTKILCGCKMYKGQSSHFTVRYTLYKEYERRQYSLYTQIHHHSGVFLED